MLKRALGLRSRVGLHSRAFDYFVFEEEGAGYNTSLAGFPKQDHCDITNSAPCIRAGA